jgi:acetoin utilization deacetylase AcuC-like enzyme
MASRLLLSLPPKCWTDQRIDEGKGFNVNVGWSRKGMGDAEYLAVWEKLLMPMAREFQPELVLVSAGLDAAVGDMGKCLDIDSISCLFLPKACAYNCYSYFDCNGYRREESAMSHLNALEG